jgi:predicted negative regulator of RcsB-dependent stress response
VELYHTDEQQLETLKKLWAKYGKQALVSLGLGFAIYLGWQAHQKHELEALKEVSLRYEETLELLDRPDEFIRAVEVFDTEVTHSVYSGLLHLQAAKLHLLNKRYEDAKQMLQQLIGNSSEILSYAGHLRLARVHIYLKEFDQALQLLEKVKAPSFTSVVQELTGDIYMLQGKEKEAKEAYTAAMAAMASIQSSIQPEVDYALKLKINDLAHIN